MMPRLKKSYVPQTIGEVWDMLGSMMLSSPTFKDDFFHDRTIDTEFARLNEGLKVVSGELGVERYSALVGLSDRMRMLFEADPEDKTGEAVAGRRLIREMEEILRPRRNGNKPKGF